jgi:hypothetical protein
LTTAVDHGYCSDALWNHILEKDVIAYAKLKMCYIKSLASFRRNTVGWLKAQVLDKDGIRFKSCITLGINS